MSTKNYNDINKQGMNRLLIIDLRLLSKILHVCELIKRNHGKLYINVKLIK